MPSPVQVHSHSITHNHSGTHIIQVQGGNKFNSINDQYVLNAKLPHLPQPNVSARLPLNSTVHVTLPRHNHNNNNSNNHNIHVQSQSDRSMLHNNTQATQLHHSNTIHSPHQTSQQMQVKVIPPGTLDVSDDSEGMLQCYMGCILLLCRCTKFKYI